MTIIFSVENTLIDNSNATVSKYFMPKSFPSFLLTDPVPCGVPYRTVRVRKYEYSLQNVRGYRMP